MDSHQENIPFVIRIAFVLANISTHFENCRKLLNSNKSSIEKCVNLALKYLKKDKEDK